MVAEGLGEVDRTTRVVYGREGAEAIAEAVLAALGDLPALAAAARERAARWQDTQSLEAFPRLVRSSGRPPAGDHLTSFNIGSY